MVFTKRLCAPEDVKATLDIRLTTSHPTVSLSALTNTPSFPVLTLKIHIKCTSSVRADFPLTFRTSGVLVPNEPFDGSIDCLALGAFGAGFVCNEAADGKRKAISLGNYRIHRARQHGDDALNLRDRPDASFITIPAQDSGEEVIITHTLSANRLFAFADGLGAKDMVIGEKYVLRLRDDFVGTGWWCWGALNDELMGKKLHAYSEGTVLDIEKPSEKEIEEGGWVVGENSRHLRFEMEDSAAMCSLEVMK